MEIDEISTVRDSFIEFDCVSLLVLDLPLFEMFVELLSRTKEEREAFLLHI